MSDTFLLFLCVTWCLSFEKRVHSLVWVLPKIPPWYSAGGSMDFFSDFLISRNWKESRVVFSGAPWGSSPDSQRFLRMQRLGRHYGIYQGFLHTACVFVWVIARGVNSMTPVRQNGNSIRCIAFSVSLSFLLKKKSPHTFIPTSHCTEIHLVCTVVLENVKCDSWLFL